MSMSFNGTNGLTFNDGSVQNTAATGFGFKNRIINGAMGISQRGTSFSTPANSAYTLDRWFIGWGGAAPTSVAQVAGPTGFRNALQITGAASNTQTFINQRIEAQNCSDFSGATVTIQVNIAVSSSQNVVWQLNYANAQDNWSSATNISAGTWSATSTATTFTATITNLPSSATNGLQIIVYPNNGGAFTSGTFTITGVQLEKGSTATSFDYRPYGTELQLCQRYYYRYNSRGANTIIATLQAFSTGGTYGKLFDLPVTMRAIPTVNTSGASNFCPASSTSASQANFTLIGSWNDTNTTTIVQNGGFSGSSGLTAGNASQLYFSTTGAAGWIEASAEL